MRNTPSIVSAASSKAAKVKHSLQAVLDNLRYGIQEALVFGFLTPEEICTKKVALYSQHYDHDADVLRPHAERIVREELKARLAEQATWPAQTDCDKLDAAFAELDQVGIVARQDYSGCETLGIRAIWD